MDAAGTEALEDGGAYTLSMSCEVPLPPGVDMRALDEKWHEGPSGRVADSGVFETPGAESVHAADKPLAQALRKFFMGRRRKPHRGRSVFDLGCGDGAAALSPPQLSAARERDRKPASCSPVYTCISPGWTGYYSMPEHCKPSVLQCVVLMAIPIHLQ